MGYDMLCVAGVEMHFFFYQGFNVESGPCNFDAEYIVLFMIFVKAH